MNFGDIAALAVAYSDLKEVTDVINAINANLPKTGPLGTIPAATRALDPRPRLRSTPELQIRPGQVNTSHSTTTQQKHVTVSVDRYEPTSDKNTIVEPVYVEASCRTRNPILPPWATLPPVPHVQVVRVVKIMHQKVDLVGRGSLLDVFV